jgi:hypothetical protein
MNISKLIVILLLVLIIILFTYKLQSKEHLTSSNEAIQSIASMYKKIYADNNTLNTINTNNLCISGNKCLSSAGLNYFALTASPLNSYMYLPNSSPTINDQNIIWKDISNNMGTNTVRPNAPIKVVGGDRKWKYWNGSTTVEWDGYVNSPYNTLNIYTTTGFENGAQSNGDGIEVTVPTHPIPGKDYSVLWIKVINDRYNYLKVYDMSGSSVRKYYGKQSFGFTSINNISPDGSTNSEHYYYCLWWPFPIDLSGNSSRKIMISCFYKNPYSPFIAGIAFSTNPWNHCRVHGNSLYDQVNNDNNLNSVSQTTSLIINEGVWSHMLVVSFVPGSQPIIRIPFVNSGRNKIFYIIECNVDLGPSMNGVEINTTPNSTTATWQYIGNLNTTFSNPFATHSNSKMYQRYYGVVIPKQYLPVKGSSINDNFMQLRFTIPSGVYFKFSEVGTHDVNPFE